MMMACHSHLHATGRNLGKRAAPGHHPEMLFQLEPTVSVDNMVKLLFIINP